MTDKDRIKELEALAYGYRYTAERLAEELVSILKPYREHDPVACAIAMERIAVRHQDHDAGKAVH